MSKLTPAKILTHNKNYAIGYGYPRYYSKGEFLETKPKSTDIAKWNKIGVGELFSVEDFLRFRPNGDAILIWNREPVVDKRVTFTEYMIVVKKIDPRHIIIWNKDNLGDNFTKRAFLLHKPTLVDIIDWNALFADQQINKDEFIEAIIHRNFKDIGKAVVYWNMRCQGDERIKGIDIFRCINAKDIIDIQTHSIRSGLGAVFTKEEFYSKNPTEYDKEDWANMVCNSITDDLNKLKETL